MQAHRRSLRTGHRRGPGTRLVLGRLGESIAYEMAQGVVQLQEQVHLWPWDTGLRRGERRAFDTAHGGRRYSSGSRGIGGDLLDSRTGRNRSASQTKEEERPG